MGAAGVAFWTGACPHTKYIMFYVYILKSKKDSNLYIGSTNDLKRRFKEHNDGKVYSTKARRPFEIVYYEAYKIEADARKREANLKLRSQAFTQLRKRIENSIK
jgi:putative endonuclease